MTILIFQSLLKNVRRLSGSPVLPPGELIDLESLERFNRKVLIELADQHGEMFKICEEGRPQICIMGLERGRNLLSQHAASLRPVNIDLTSLFSAGFMRLMAGETHKRYRNALIAALNELDTVSAQNDLDVIAIQALRRYQKARPDPEFAAQAFRDALSDISAGFLIRLFFGARPGSELFEQLVTQFYRLGPHGVVWNVTEIQKREFKEICATLSELTHNDVLADNSNILSTVFHGGNLDETMLGNLIYMVEIGRYDMGGLFRWIARNAAVHADHSAKIATESDAIRSREIAQAFVRETLRMDQSERLIREVTDGFRFEGFDFQKGWRVRICLWESHKDATSFADSFTFNPDRFLISMPSSNVFAPFGLDNHQCPFSAISVSLGTQFLQSLLRNFQISAVNDGASMRGPYHWEPPIDFSVTLSQIEN